MEPSCSHSTVILDNDVSANRCRKFEVDECGRNARLDYLPPVVEKEREGGLFTANTKPGVMRLLLYDDADDDGDPENGNEARVDIVCLCVCVSARNMITFAMAAGKEFILFTVTKHRVQ